MGGDSFCGDDDDDIDWNSDDEREIDNSTGFSSITMTVLNGQAMTSSGEGSSVGSCERDAISKYESSNFVDHFVSMGFPANMVVEAIQEQGEENSDLILETLLRNSANSSGPSCEGSSGSKVIDHFLRMGFSEELVIKAIQENGEENTDLILESLLTVTAVEKSPEGQEEPNNDSDLCLSEYEGSFLDDFSDLDSAEDEETNNHGPHNDTPLLYLTKMGYNREEASIAIERCGQGATIAELTDFICAAQMAKAADPFFPEEKSKVKSFDKPKKRGYMECESKRKKQMRLEEKLLSGDDELIRLPNPMIGFGLPTEPGTVTRRNLPQAAMGPPYFYYENVALAPKGVWATISRFLYDVEPEFVDSQYMCAAKRKRGYIHNLPIENRFPLLPLPPLTIHEAFQ